MADQQTVPSKYIIKKWGEAQPSPDPYEVRIKESQGHVKGYVDHACSLLLGGTILPAKYRDDDEELKPDIFDTIIIRAFGKAINKAVTTAEIVKRRISGLHQVTSLETRQFTDVWEPIEQGLYMELETKRFMACITITLSREESCIDKGEEGYQTPFIGDNYRDTQNEKIAENISNDNASIDNVYGSVPNQTSKTFKWHIKCIKNRTGSMTIGIGSAQHYDEWDYYHESYYYHDSRHPDDPRYRTDYYDEYEDDEEEDEVLSYEYVVDGNIYECGKQIEDKQTAGWKEGDIVTLIYDGRNKTISISINGKNEPISRLKVKHNAPGYRLCIHLTSEDDKVEIVGFESNDGESEQKMRELIEKEKVSNIVIESMRTENQQKQGDIESLQQEIKQLKMEAQQRMDDEKEEKEKLDETQKIARIDMDLENELNIFKDKYNENKLQQILDNKPDDLLNKESDLNKDYIGYRENVDKILLCSKSFSKYIQDTDEIMKRLTTPDIANYKSWNVDQILLWIKGLEGGRFNKHIDKLKFGFEKSEIVGEDLPDLTRNDLSSQPFDIGNFRDRKQLEIYFKSLLNPLQQKDNNIAVAARANEGDITVYV